MNEVQDCCFDGFFICFVFKFTGILQSPSYNLILENFVSNEDKTRRDYKVLLIKLHIKPVLKYVYIYQLYNSQFDFYRETFSLTLYLSIYGLFSSHLSHA